MLMIQNELFDDEKCTFVDRYCINNEDPREIVVQLDKAINFAEQYINAY